MPYYLSMSTIQEAKPVTVTANAEGWGDSQIIELNFWKNHWPYRNLTMPELQTLRANDARWLLTSMGFKQTADNAFEGFTGSVLEVGCGPMGFFELTEGVQATANDSLMEAYAKEIWYSTLGKRGNATYVPTPVQHIQEKFDFVVCSNVLDHTADWLEFYELLANRVNPTGQLILMTHTRGQPMPGHTQVFTPEQLVRVANWLGFSKVYHHHASKSQDNHSDYHVFLRAGRA